jgi:hypothetical protein
MMNPKISDLVGVAATIDPDVTAAGTVTSDWVAMKDFDQVLAVVLAGTLGSSATVDAKIEQATDGSGTDAKDVTGKAITQMTQAGTDQSDTQAVIGVSAADLDVANDFTHVRLSITVGTATSDVGGVIVGLASDLPATAVDLTSVGEVV